MAYVPVPKDLTKVKTKVMFNLTKRQLICFTGGALIGVPLFFLLRKPTGNSVAAMCMMLVMLPFFMLAMYEKHTCLFKDTLLNNIKAARPDATREEVLKAADEAQCKDIIDRLPDGLDTLVGTGGTYLSGGENQRIALARAILKDAPIIVLDEATAFADAENEHQIQLAFERLTQNKTVMMIAHRLSTIQDADLILVFKEGQIAERGTHEELVALNGIYSSMWKDYQTSIAWKVGKEDEQHD